MSSGEDGPSWSRANGNSVSITAVVKAVGEARRSGFVEYSTTTGLAVAESSGENEAGSSGSRTICTTSAAAAKTVGEVRPRGIAKYMVAAKSEFGESSGGAVKSAGKDRPLGEAEYSAATKFEIAEYAGEFPTLCWENIAGQVVGYRTIAESAKRSGRKCDPAKPYRPMTIG